MKIWFVHIDPIDDETLQIDYRFDGIYDSLALALHDMQHCGFTDIILEVSPQEKLPDNVSIEIYQQPSKEKRYKIGEGIAKYMEINSNIPYS